jgi:vacuolar-type H+-ATPase subunit H
LFALQLLIFRPQARRKVREAQRLAHAALRDAREEASETGTLLLSLKTPDQAAAGQRLERHAEQAAEQASKLIREARSGLASEE